MQEIFDRNEFNEVVAFHGCYCLDIAMGYRVAKALVREMGDHMTDMKKVYGHVGADTCAVDAFQKITGCTVGKRNLIFTGVGKPVYILQNSQSAKALRAYCHFWDHFDHTEIRAKRQKANAANATPADKAAFSRLMDEQINAILTMPEADLFSIKEVNLPSPPKSGKYHSKNCEVCGESTKEDLLVVKAGGQYCCPECATKT